jgi:hypothetical protein
MSTNLCNELRELSVGVCWQLFHHSRSIQSRGIGATHSRCNRIRRGCGYTAEAACVQHQQRGGTAPFQDDFADSAQNRLRLRLGRITQKLCGCAHLGARRAVSSRGKCEQEEVVHRGLRKRAREQCH